MWEVAYLRTKPFDLQRNVVQWAHLELSKVYQNHQFNRDGKCLVSLCFSPFCISESYLYVDRVHKGVANVPSSININSQPGPRIGTMGITTSSIG